MRLGKTRAELRASMTHREFMQWAVWNSISPIGDERCHDLGPALSRMTAAQIAAKPNTKFLLEDFLPYAHRPKLANDWEQELLDWARKEGRHE